MTYENILFEVRDGVAVITLNRPKVLNALNRALLKSGAAIGEINAVRKHLSRIKGGRLGRLAYPDRLCEQHTTRIMTGLFRCAFWSLRITSSCRAFS